MTLRDRLINDITAAFPARRPQDLGPLVTSHLGDEPLRVAQAFADQPDWRVLTADWLDRVPTGLGSALSFLSDAAVCFYLPAYLVADLAVGLQRVDPVFYLVHGLDRATAGKPLTAADRPDCRTWGDYARARWAGLTRQQAQAVVQYLEYSAATRPEVRPAASEALADYWYGRVG